MIIDRSPQEDCPACGSRIRKPYLTSFREFSERRLYECPKCGERFAVVYDVYLKEGMKIEGGEGK